MVLLHKLRRLTPTDRNLLFRATLMLAATRLALACLPFRSVRRLLRPSPPPALRSPGALSWPVDRISWAVQAASRRVLGDKPCLAQALVTHRLLTESGYSSDLRIGVAKDDTGGLEAHAWVERQGQTIVGAGQLARYSPLPALKGDCP